MTKVGDLVAEFRSGSVRALARAITLVEHRDPAVRELMGSLADRARIPVVLGFTGAPGTGKSTLVAGLIGHLRELDAGVAGILIDPNSTYSGGGILGDRIRMQPLARHTRALRRLERSGEAERRKAARRKDEAADLVGEWSRAEARRLLDEDADLNARLLGDRTPYATAEEILARGGPGAGPGEADG